MTVDELEEAETNEDIKKFVQGGDSTSWAQGANRGAAAVGIKFQSGIWRFANNLSRKIFGISLRRGFFCFTPSLSVRLRVPCVHERTTTQRSPTQK